MPFGQKVVSESELLKVIEEDGLNFGTLVLDLSPANDPQERVYELMTYLDQSYGVDLTHTETPDNPGFYNVKFTRREHIGNA